MPRRIAMSTLNASTLDILNTIRANASYEYQNAVPEISDVRDIPKVGEILMGYPALANQFVNALINRIALVRVKAATFNNAYAMFKKGYLEFGETVEEVFISVAKAREFSVEKAKDREFRRTLPDVRAAFHVMNYKAQYPVTIQDEDLRMAFQSAEGVRDLIAKIVDSIYTGAEYDEYLLFKYLMIKAIAGGKMKPVGVDTSDLKNAAIAYRGTSNMMTFMKRDYNAEGVLTTTPKADQYIFMDAQYNARYDVNVLSAAFNMDKAEYSGKLVLIDDWGTFDNERFSEIVESGQMEEVTADELAITAKVVGVLLDSEWFQVYDNLAKFTETYVSSGLYWNYFYNVWKTVSSSPFSNAVVFVDNTVTIQAPATIAYTVASKSVSENGTTVLTFELTDTDNVNPRDVAFIQDETLTEGGIAVHKYGAVIIPEDDAETSIALTASLNGVGYTGSAITAGSEVGDTLTFTKNA